MKKKMTDKHKMMAYVLNKDEDFNFPMKKIGDMMGVSQSTVSNSVKEVEFRNEIHNLKIELDEAKTQLIDNGIEPQRKRILLKPINFITE